MTSLVMAWLAGVAQAGEPDDGVPVTVRVVDAVSRAPIPTAVVRHPDEQDRHRVNSASGEWTGSVLYLPDGTELLFAKGLQLELEVSAPEYVNSRLSYKIRKRRNVVEVALQKMQLDLSEEDPDNVTIQFGRDTPIE